MLLHRMKPLQVSTRVLARHSTQGPKDAGGKVSSSVQPQETNLTATSPSSQVSSFPPQREPKYISAWHQRESDRFTFMRSFYKEESNAPLIKFLQSSIDLSPSGIKAWWRQRQREKNIIMQSYIPERNQILGNELAAAHFVVHRGGAVKFHNENRWIKADHDLKTYDLPNTYDPSMVLQAIDCDNMELHYEGLVNLAGLRRLEWLSLYDCANIDDWCMDRVCGIFERGLLYLDIRECPKITERGLGAVYRMEDLKILRVSHRFFYSEEFEMTCIMLQDLNPELDIKIE